MKLRTRFQLLLRILKWRLTWGRYDPVDGIPVPGNPTFMSPDQAAALIRDGSVLMMSGLGGNARASLIYWAIRRRFEQTGHPALLTVMTVGGIGGRGRVPGTVEELGQKGLCTRFISGHLETFKSQLRLAAAGALELHCLPQGVMVQLLEGQGRGDDTLRSTTGLGTFMDPRQGQGSRIQAFGTTDFVQPEGEGLRFTMPKVDVAIFNLPAADAEGNLYARNAAMVAECQEAARAARRNQGKVIVSVGELVPKNPAEIFLRADEVDAIVLHPRTEQTGSVPHHAHWPVFTPHSDLTVEEGLERVRFINRILGITPQRTRLDDALARLAATLVVREVRPGALVNIGVGLPEEVCRVLHQSGVGERVTFFTEAGAIGGVPAPGIFFWAAICPERLVSSAEVFRMSRERLDIAVLGMLEADSLGNVNVSKRGEGPLNAVGTGGFMDFTAAARTILFVGSWMTGGRMDLARGGVRVLRKGSPKFVDRVSEVTFSGAQALKAGKRVFYCTHVGAFQLTERGMELVSVMPGIDLERDILGAVPMLIQLPASGQVPVVDPAVLTGRGFDLGRQEGWS